MDDSNRYEVISDLFQRHRSIRTYRPEPIDDALLQRVLQDAIHGSSSSGNLNSVSMVLTQDPDRKQKLYELHYQQDMILQAPLLITFCADWFRTREWLRARGARDNFNNLIGYQVAAFDAMILAQSVCLGFEALGLGICYMGTTLFSMRGISDLLDLPETCVPVTTIVVGYPDEAPGQRDRLPASAWIHNETYHRPDSAEIDAIFEERERRGWERYMSMPHLKAMAEKNGITSLAQFYTSKIKYDPDDFAVWSQEIRLLLEEKGF